MLPELPIRTDHLTIDELTAADLDDLYSFMRLPQIMQFLPDRFDRREDLEEVLEWLISNYGSEANDVVRITLAVRLKDSGAFIGWVSYGPLPYDEKLKELAYAISPDHWNRGYATTASRGFLEWLRANITDEDIYAEIDPTNVRSERVLTKLGFTKVKDDRVTRDNRRKNVRIYRWAS